MTNLEDDYPFEYTFDANNPLDIIFDAVVEYNAIGDELPEEVTEKDYVLSKLKLAGFENGEEEYARFLAAMELNDGLDDL